MDLQDAVAIVTGASGGIGEAIARELRKAGAKIVLVARDQAKLDALATELGEAVVVAGDVTDPAMPDRFLAAAIERFGRADILVNNAGMMHVGKIEDIDLDKMVAMVRLNVESLFRASYVFLRHCRPLDRGYLVNISSIAGLKTVATLAAYNGSKAAVEAFTDALRLELAGSGIGVTAIAPGTVETNLYSGWEQGAKDYIFSGGSLVPADIARCVRFAVEQPPHMRVPRMLVVPAAQPV
jgi:NADP-dependent 3-hydroxy acid dehydrogenase YdfG